MESGLWARNDGEGLGQAGGRNRGKEGDRRIEVRIKMGKAQTRHGKDHLLGRLSIH